MVVGLLDNESPDSKRFTLVTPKPANGVRLQATLDNQNPTGLPVGAVRKSHTCSIIVLDMRLLVYLDGTSLFDKIGIYGD